MTWADLFVAVAVLLFAVQAWISKSLVWLAVAFLVAGLFLVGAGKVAIG